MTFENYLLYWLEKIFLLCFGGKKKEKWNKSTAIGEKKTASGLNVISELFAITLCQGSAKISSVKGQRVNISGFPWYRVSVVTTSLCHNSMKAV